jgi:hypothetical protein
MSQLSRDPCGIGAGHKADSGERVARLLWNPMADPDTANCGVEYSALHLFVRPWFAGTGIAEYRAVSQSRSCALSLQGCGGPRQKLDITYVVRFRSRLVLTPNAGALNAQEAFCAVMVGPLERDLLGCP